MRPQAGGSFWLPPGNLGQDLDVAGFFALRTSAAFERNALVFRETLEAVRLDVLKVGEQVRAACIRCDKAEALSVVEPFDYAGLSRHVISFELNYRQDARGT